MARLYGEYRKDEESLEIKLSVSDAYLEEPLEEPYISVKIVYNYLSHDGKPESIEHSIYKSNTLTYDIEELCSLVDNYLSDYSPVQFLPSQDPDFEIRLERKEHQQPISNKWFSYNTFEIEVGSVYGTDYLIFHLSPKDDDIKNFNQQLKQEVKELVEESNKQYPKRVKK